MAFGSVFSRMKLPNKVGKIGPQEEGDKEYFYQIKLEAFEGSPEYKLEKSLAIGSEVGDILIEEEGIAPRHCTFVLNQDVVLLMDNGSSSGTYIGKKKLEAGRAYIVSESDEIWVHDILIKLEKISKAEEIIVNEDITAEDIERELDQTIPDLVLEEIIPKKEKEFKTEPRPYAKVDEPTISYIKVSNINAANTFIRVLAFLVDCSFLYALLSLYGQEETSKLVSEFISFDSFTAFVLAEAHTYIPNLNDMVETLGIGELDLFLKTMFQFYFIFIVYRVITTLVLGATLGQTLLGLKVSANLLVARALGVVREILWGLTSPFVFLTHIGTLLSKRSLQEVLSFTRLESSSFLKTSLLTIVVLPLCLGLVLVAPVLKGFSEPELIIYQNDLKKKESVEATIVSFSKTMKVGSLNADRAFAAGRIEQQGQRTFFFPEIIFEQDNSALSIQLKKNFSFPSILRILFSQMFLDQVSFPELRSFANASDNLKKEFQTKQANIELMQMSGELDQIFQSFLNPSLANLGEIIPSFGPMAQAMMDFRQALSQLVDGEIEEVRLTYFGQHPVVLLSKKYELDRLYFFPIGMIETPFYELSLARGEVINAKINKLHQEVFNGFIFSEEFSLGAENTSLTAFQVVDELAKIVADKEVDEKKIFEFYFNQAKDLMLTEESENQFFLANLNKVLRLVDKSNSEAKYMHLIQSLSELKNAVEIGDKAFFTPEQ